MGDSGGSGIVVTTLLYLVRHGLPTPGNSVLIFPFVSLVDNFMSDSELLKLDALNPGAYFQRMLSPFLETLRIKINGFLPRKMLTNITEMCSNVSYQYTENRPELRGIL
jgi:acetyl esterase/lipase